MENGLTEELISQKQAVLYRNCLEIIDSIGKNSNSFSFSLPLTPLTNEPGNTADTQSQTTSKEEKEFDRAMKDFHSQGAPTIWYEADARVVDGANALLSRGENEHSQDLLGNGKEETPNLDAEGA